MEKLRKYKGITVIALIITIIILLILAGITISSLTNSGLFDKVKEAKGKWKNVQNEEEMQLAKYSNKIDSYVDGNRNLSSETLLFPATEDGSAADTTNTPYNLNQSYKNFKYLLVEGEAYPSGHSGTSTLWIPTKNIKNVDSYINNTSHANWSFWVASGNIGLYFKSDTSFAVGSLNGGVVLTHIYGFN